MTYEIAVTRIFAVVLQFHLVFLVVSVAVCGIGLGSMAVQLRRQRSPASPAPLDIYSVGFGVAATGALCLVLLWSLRFHAESYWLTALIMLLPFLFVGAFMADVFGHDPHRAGSLYGADLAGAGLGAICTVALLNSLGGIRSALLGCAVGGILPLALLSRDRPRTWRMAAVAAGVLMVAIGSALDLPRIETGQGASAGTVQPLYAELDREASDPAVIVYSQWDSFARTDVVDRTAEGPRRSLEIYTNGNVPSPMVRVDADLRRGDATRTLASFLASDLAPPLASLPFSTMRPDRVLSIGPGGGLDVLLALGHGARHVSAVELNPAIIPIMRRFAEFNGHLYDHPSVNAVHADGRTFLHGSNDEYDLIFSALTQTSVATRSLTLVESYVNTIEAFEEYWEHLSPTGALVLVAHDPAHGRRYATTAAQLLSERGYSGAEAIERLALISGGPAPYSFMVLLSRSPLAPSVAEDLVTGALEASLEPLLVPGVVEPPVPQGSAQEAIVAAVGDEVPAGLSMRPTTDERPFFYDLDDRIPSSIAGALVFALSAIVALSCWAWRQSARAAGVRTVVHASYFAMLGVGFMLIEIPLIQKLTLLLGFPTLALAVAIGGLLIGGGIGATWSQRVETDRLAQLTRRTALVIAVAVAALASFSMQLTNLLALGFTVRLLLMSAAVGLLGLGLGVPFSSGIRMLADRYPGDIPWMTGVNGVMSVVGSVAAVLGARSFGFSVVFAGAAIIYVGIGWLAPHLGRASSVKHRHTRPAAGGRRRGR